MRRLSVVTVAAFVLLSGALGAAGATPIWRLQSTQTPTGATSTGLNGVSCPKLTTVCFAAGSFQTSTATDTLVEKWTGSAWVHQSSPNPSGTQSTLWGITCRAANWCEAVGQERVISSGAWKTLAEHWNGTSWSVQSTPSPTGGFFTKLASVSCPATNDCIAVGEYSLNGTSHVIADRWNGTSWSTLSLSNPAGTGPAGAYLPGVSCVSTTACIAVGYYKNTSSGWLVIARRWNGSSWSVMSIPNPGTYLYRSLFGITCLSTSMCIATGGRDTSTTGYTLAERWNGSAWSVMSTPTPSGLIAAALYKVSCPASNVCEAIGFRQANSGSYLISALAEHWNGVSWSLQTIPNPSGSHNTTPQDISCVSTVVCEGVGSWQPTTTTTHALAERYS